PPFEMLVSVPPIMQSEFRDWVTGVQSRVARRDVEEQHLATERKRQSRLDKARRFAVRSAATLPPNAARLRDGSCRSVSWRLGPIEPIGRRRPSRASVRSSWSIASIQEACW
ncbi:MAG TPA: hypothetical protein VNG33_08850, partial [Polyangiaceae bacterium]|nr:hypothetical protein [Polyangiaceae bacterium]